MATSTSRGPLLQTKSRPLLPHMLLTHDDEITKASLPIPLCSTSNDDILRTEDEIERHFKIIIDLKIRRNGYLAINKLPVEILCRIFHFVQATWTEDSVSTYYRGGPTHQEYATWITVARVCHHWRNTALHDPSLWTRPYLQYPKWTVFMLERSRRAALRLFIDKSSVHEEAVFAVVAHIPRTVELIIQEMHGDDIRQLLAIFQSTEAPMLQELVIEAMSPSRSWRSSTADNDNPPRLHDSSFLNARKLLRLSLKIVDIGWTSHLFASSLTHLHINSLSNRARPSPSEFMTVLERLTGLKSLNLTDVLPLRGSILSNPLPTRERIILPDLEELRVDSEVSECQFLWNNITTSNNLKDISARVTYVAESTLSLPGFLEAVYTADVSNHLALNSRTVYFDGDGRDTRRRHEPRVFSMEMGAETATSYDNTIHLPIEFLSNHATPCNFSLHVNCPPTPTMYTNVPFHAIFSDLCAAARWDTLTTLALTYFYVEKPTPPEFALALARTLGTLPDLCLVIVGSPCAKPFVDALLLNADKDPADAPQSVVFPGLRYIVFDGVYFGWGEYLDVPMTILQDCCMDRYERGAEIYSISIENCENIDDKDFYLLQEIVVDVEWDGRGRRESGDQPRRRWF